MKKQTALRRLLAVRALQEDMEETRLLLQQRQYASYAASLEAGTIRRSEAVLQRIAAVAQPDAMSAALDFNLLQARQERLVGRTSELQAELEQSRATWLRVRQDRRQVETYLERERERLARELDSKEQKRLDDWFLSGWRGVGTEEPSTLTGIPVDEAATKADARAASLKTLREHTSPGSAAGTPRAPLLAR